MTQQTFQVDIWYKEDGISKRLPFTGTLEEIALQIYLLYDMRTNHNQYIHFKSQPGLDTDKLSSIIKQYIAQESV